MFDCIEEYAPGFRKLVIDKEVLTPPDLERIFGLTGGVRFLNTHTYYFIISLIMQQNIFHGAMSLDQLYLARPTYSQPCYQGQPKGVYLCGSGSHPGELLM